MTCHCYPQRVSEALATAELHATDAKKSLNSNKPFSALQSAMTAARWLSVAEESANLGCPVSVVEARRRRKVATMLSDIDRSAGHYAHLRERG